VLWRIKLYLVFIFLLHITALCLKRFIEFNVDFILKADSIFFGVFVC